MKLDFSQNNINIVFEVTEGNTVALTHFSHKGIIQNREKNLKWCGISDIHITGENPDDHHGGKHTGTYGGLNLKYKSHNYYENEYGNKLEFNLVDEKMEVIAHYQFYKEISAVRCWTVVTNIGDEPIGLEYVSSFGYTGLENNNPTVYIPHNAWFREINWKKYTLSDLGFDRTNNFSSKRITVSNTGTWSTKEYLPMGVFENENNTLMWQIENNGSWQWEISDISDMLYIKLSGPTDVENQWYKELKKGESFESVKACITVGTDFEESLEHMTKYRRVIFENNEPNKKVPVIFNDYMNCLMGDPTTEKLMPIIEKAAMTGAEYFCIDAGWYADGTWWDSVGEWKPSTWRFPNGIKEVLNFIKSKGMIPGLWLEIEVMGIFCPILDKFEDDCFFVRRGKRIIDHSRYQLDFRNEKVRKFATSVVDRLVKDYGVGYFKLDYNIEAGAGTEINSDSFGDGLLSHNRAYLGWIDSIKAKYPDLILENCSSGGMRMEYSMLAKHHLQSASDQTDYRYTAAIAAASATAVLPEQSAVWAYPKEEDNEDAVIFNMINAMLQRIHLSGTIQHMEGKRMNLIVEAINCYKKIREDIPKSIPVYPMGLPMYTDEWICRGLRCGDKTYLSVWRLDSDKENITIPLEAVKTGTKLYPMGDEYKIEIENCGVNVSLPDKYTAVLFEVKR